MSADRDYAQAGGICSHIGCGHAYESHSPFNGTMCCGECARPWEGLNAGGEFHMFEGPRLAGGAYSASAEREAYDRVMRGES